MTEKRVLLIKTTLAEYDARLEREIEVLKGKGYRITLLCWDRECLNNAPPSDTRYKEIRFMLRAPFGVKVLLFLPIWWCFELFYILKLKSHLIHAIDFDSIIPAIIAGKIKRIPVIYELFDIYEDEIQMPESIRNFLIFIDKIFMSLSDVIIIVDETRIKEVNGIPNKKIVTIYNSPPDLLLQINPVSSHNKAIILFFAGALSKSRSFDEIIEAVKTIDNAKLIIAGFGELAEKISIISNQNRDKIDFIGKINYKQVLELSFSADILFSFYDPAIRLHKFASSNKLFEAMMCGKPVIVNDGSSMADIVRQEDCGIVVPYGDVNAIRIAILQLRDKPELREKFGINGRRAYDKKYNWNLMEQKLVETYESLLSGTKG